MLSGIDKFNKKAKTKWILVVVVKCRHRENGLLNVNVFRTKGIIEDNTVFTSATGDGTTILRGHLSHAKAVPSFLGVFVRSRESNPRPLKRSSGWACPAVEIYVNPQHFKFIFVLVKRSMKSSRSCTHL